ncbi:MAG: beta-galactosidase [Muribaculaceae bacterium]|nr:beta-galactosidase [Muribaculaceae bacterium]
MKKSGLFLLALLSTISICSHKASGAENVPFIDPTPGEISIVASTPIPADQKPSREAFETLIDCGFNMGMETNSFFYFKNIFEILGDLKFKYLINNPDLLNDNRVKFIDQFSRNKHFAGWKVSDEPRYDGLDNLAKQFKALHTADPKALIYMNLIGSNIKVFTGNSKNFSEYIQLIQKKFMPGIWSYDLYPFLEKNGKVSASLPTFYSDLEIFKNISQKTSRPFWTYVQTMAYKAGTLKRPATTEAYLRFAVFTSLAYGAQGIVYWTYGQRASNKNETYYSALVNLKGEKYPAWSIAKKVNGEIKKFNNVFYNCKVKQVKHTGNVIYDGTTKLTGVFGPFTRIGTGTAGATVSEIINGKNTYIVIVSHDAFASQKLTLNLDRGRKVTNLTDTKQTQYSAPRQIDLTLDKGGYLIFRVDE